MPSSFSRAIGIATLILAVGSALVAPAAFAQTGQKAPGHAGTPSGATYEVCTPSASNNYCGSSGPIGMSAPAHGGGEAPDASCNFNGKCTQAKVASGDLMITVAPGFTNMPNVTSMSGPAQMALAVTPAPYYATLSVTHNDHNSSCEKIYQVVVNTQWNGGQFDIAHANLPNGECNFANFILRVPLASIGEVEACPRGGVIKSLHVVLMSHNMWGQLTKDDHSDTFTPARVFVSCPPLTPRLATVTPVSYSGACPAGITLSASFDSNGNGPMSTIWAFGNGTIIHGSSTARAGQNSVALAPARVTASMSTTVSLRVSGPGGTVSSGTVPYVVQCR